MKIGELSKKTGLSIDTIRFYEKNGLISKALRSDSNYRDFNESTADTLEFVAHCRSLDIPIPQIKKLLHVRSGSTKSCREANQVIEEQIANLRTRISELKRLEKALTELGKVCHQELDPMDCKIIKSLQSARR